MLPHNELTPGFGVIPEGLASGLRFLLIFYFLGSIFNLISKIKNDRKSRFYRVLVAERSTFSPSCLKVRVSNPVLTKDKT